MSQPAIRTYLFFIFIFLGASSVMAQIIGLTSLSQGMTKTYSYNDGTVYSSANWTVDNGNSVQTQTVSGTKYMASITFSTPGNTTVRFYNGAELLASLVVSVACAPPAPPSTSFTYTNNCGNTVITRTSSPPSGQVWWWETSSTGTSTSYGSGSSFTVTTGGTYYLVAQSTAYNCWSSGTATSAVTVNASPTVDVVTSQTLCNGAATNSITFTGTATTYSWTNDNTSIGLAASGTGNINSFTAVNNGGTWTTANIVVTPSNSSCSGTSVHFAITVNPSASMSAPGSQTVCNGSATTAINFSGSATSYSWTNDNASTGLAGSGSGNINSFTATNSTGAPITSTITVTPVLSGCSGPSQQFTITVNPTPVVNTQVSVSACNGASTSPITFSGTATVFNWSNNDTTIGLNGGGTNTIPSFTATNNNSTPEVATITVTPVYGSCAGTAQQFNITVNPTPTMNTIGNQTVCNGASTAAVSFSGTAQSYTWTNDTPSIGLASSGTGDIAVFSVTNSGSSPLIATITATPVYKTCTGSNQTFTITANPTPTVNTPASQTVCTAVATAVVSFTGIATSYSWTNNNTSVGLGASGYNNIPSFTAANTGSTQQVATIIVTPLYGSCAGTTQSSTITVNPVATVNATANQTVCTGAVTGAVSFSGTGTSYTWTNNNTSVGLVASGSGNIAAFTTTNAGSTPQVATITVTPWYASCSGTAQSFTITVNPVPAVNTPANQTVCKGAATTAVTFSGVATSYTWTNNNTSIGLAASGTGNIASFTSINAGTTQQVATVIVTPSYGSCIGPTKSFSITVNPAPTVNTPANQSVCKGAATAAVTFSGIATSYTWTNNNTSIGLGASGTGNIGSFTTVNTGNTQQVATIVVTPKYGTCSGTTQTFTITVKPMPIASAASPSLFSGSTTSITLNSTVSGTTFSYTPTTTTNVSNALAGTSSPISQTLMVTDGINPGTVSYTITPTAAGCIGTTATSTVSVYPTPTLKINGGAYAGSVYLNYGYGLTFSTSTFYYSYQWYKDGTVLTGATQYSFVPTIAGVYNLVVQASSTGPAATSASITVIKPNGQVDDVNMVSYTRFYKAGLTTSSSLYSLQPTDLAQAITYKDGLGRSVQTVAVGQAGNGGDLIAPTVNGKNGLADSTFLPYASTTEQGRFHKNAVRGTSAYSSYTSSEQYNFYQTTTTKTATDTNPYARALFRNTPDARVTEQGAPGSDWQPGSTHTVRNQLTLSTSTNLPVRQWNANGTTSGNYPDRTVTVAVITDENNHLVRTYTDRRGLTVLKQVQSNSSTWLETYYIYDIYGQLIYQLPPLAMTTLGTGASLNANNTSVAELIYKYTYDTRGRLVEKKVPGSALQWIVYDKLDRPVLTQDGNQRAQGVWAFVKYDFKNRHVYTGLYTSASDRPTLQNLFDTTYDYTATGNAQPWFETRTNVATWQGYTNNVFPTANIQLLSVSYYDDYDFDNSGTADYSYDNTHLSGIPTAASAQTRGLPTGSKKLILNTTTWLTSVVFYDNLDRPIQTLGNNHLNPTLQDKASVLYWPNDLSTHVQKTYATHVSTATVNVLQRYTYDNAWRTVGIYHTINGGTEQQLASYEYNALGQMVDKKLHVSGGSFLQSVDMRYNIRGWLNSINNAQLAIDNGVNPNNDDTNDYFGMELFYNTVENSGLGNAQNYNGNISAIKWKNGGVASGAADQRSYKYMYDYSDKLTAANFNAYSGSAWTKESGTLDENVTLYDVNGNIKTLTRYQNNRGLNGTTVTSTPQQIDNLTYTYATGNQLSKVTDAAITAGGFTDGANNTTEYTYTTHGSLTADQNKGISGITYNVLGKAQQITYTSGTTIVYTYDASGVKLKTATTVSGTTTTTDYVSSFVYTNGSLSFFSSPEGRVVKNGSAYEYQYAIADHQGNTRVLFTSAVQVAQAVTATFETANQPTESTEFNNYGHISAIDNHTPGGTNSQYLNGGYAGMVGVGKSYKVFPGDQLKIEAYGSYNQNTGSSSLTSFAGALLAAFGLPTPAAGETGTPSAALNTWGGIEAGGYGDGSTDNTDPKAFVNIVLFDKNYNFLDVAYAQLKGTYLYYLTSSYTVKEAGYAYIYVSNEQSTMTDVYFDDVKMTYTPSNVLQCNEYYPFGLQTATSWTRDNATQNNFLANGGTELNITSQLYDLDFRNYDPVLGRMHQVDPMADKYSRHTPYNYAFNSPVMFNDVNGADPIKKNGNTFTINWDEVSEGEEGSMWESTGGRPEDPGGFGVSANGGGSGVYGAAMQPGWNMVTTYYKTTYYCAACENENGEKGLTWSEYSSEVEYVYFEPELTQDDPQTWYYVYKSAGGPHGLVYDPYNKIFYDVNHPNNGNTNGLKSWLNGGAKSVGYKFDMTNAKQAAAFWDFGGGRGTLLLAPVEISDPAAATAFFESNVGKEWDYNFFTNNCKDYACQGFRLGGSTVSQMGPEPSLFGSGFTMYWNSSMSGPMPIQAPQMQTPSGPGLYKR